MTIHPAALEGFSREAGAYERGRPEYPPALHDWLRDAVGVQAGARVADVGAGTGKFTRLLAQSGAEVVAIEPVAAMRDTLAAALPGVQALDGSAEALPLEAASLDALLCGQAFHWFASTDALREFHRVLRPGGRLGMVWNVRDEAVDWVAAITAILTPHEGDAPRFHSGAWKRPFAQQDAAAPWFSAPERQVFTLQHVGPFEQVVVDRFMSVSFIAALPAEKRAAVKAQLEALRHAYPALQAQVIEFPYRTEAWVATRIG